MFEEVETGSGAQHPAQLGQGRGHVGDGAHPIQQAGHHLLTVEAHLLTQPATDPSFNAITDSHDDGF